MSAHLNLKPQSRNYKSRNYKRGLLAEEQARTAYGHAGYEVLAMRYKTKEGEIDLIAQKGTLLCFAEVKQRREIDWAAEAITVRQKQRIFNAAQLWLSAHPEKADFDCRFDAVLIDQKANIKIIENAWLAF